MPRIITTEAAQRRQWRAEKRDLKKRLTSVTRDASREVKALAKAAAKLRKRVRLEHDRIARRAAILDGRLSS